MVNIQCFSLSKEVVEALEQVPHGSKSGLVNDALLHYFELNPDLIKTRESRKTTETYPPVEITVSDL